VSSYIESASQEWRNGLIDVGGNNRLLYFKRTKAVVDLDRAPKVAIERLLAGNSVRLAELFVEPTMFEAARKACELIAKKEQEATEEFGISIAYLAAGLATWSPEAATPEAPDDETSKRRARVVPPTAPVFLRPLKLTVSSGVQKSWTLELADEFEPNSVLEHVMNQSGERLDSDALLEPAPTTLSALDEALNAVMEACSDVEGFEIEPTLILSTFTYTKQPMVDDVSDLAALGASDLALALAGDTDAARRVRSFSDGVDEAMPDRVDVDGEFIVLDADASQSFVVNAAMAGRNLVVQGPPGTGKSQTIANIIASAMALGKSVLFVAQKRAAVSAVLDRLNSAGLEHLTLDLFAADSSRRYVAERLQDALDWTAKAGLPDVHELHHSLGASRDRLVRSDAAMHSPTRGWGISVAELLAAGAKLGDGVRIERHEPVSRFAGWSQNDLPRLADAFDDLQRLGALRPAWSTAAGWSPAAITSLDISRALSDLAVDIEHNLLPTALQAVSAAAAEVGLPAPESWGDIETLRAQFDEVTRLRVIAPGIQDPSTTRETISAALTRLDRSWRAQTPVQPRAARAALRALKPALRVVPRRERSALLSQTLRLRDGWVGAATYAAPASWTTARDPLAALQAALGQLQPAVQHLDIATAPFAVLAESLALLRADRRRQSMPRAAELTASIESAQLGATRVAIEAHMAVVGETVLAGTWLRRIVYQSLLKDALDFDPVLAGLTGADRSAAAKVFQEKDVDHLAANAVRIRRLAAERLVAALDAEPEQHIILKKEAARKTRFTPVRRLFTQAPDVMLAAKPVWAMSPLQVSRLLPAQACFDIVIFDEASQVKPSDAIPALLRAPQAIVAGDSRQLPPTEFFSKVIDSIEEEPEEDAQLDAASEPPEQRSPRVGSLTRDTESILIAMDTLLAGQSRSLQWHYRSRDERLIAVSNKEIYSGSLTTFPAADTPDAITHIVVPPSPGIGATTNSPEAEVAEVMRLVREHAAERPHESLGVISFGEKHKNRLDAALWEARNSDPVLESWLSTPRVEPFFIKNVERVQGDERDSIILTIGYGKNPVTGKLQMMWGPLLQPGGERRVNVAISRAKVRMTLVSSFGPDDLGENANSSSGYSLVRSFVRFMAGEDIDEGTRAEHPLNAFEIDIRDRLVAEGLAVDTQYGVGQYRLDFAVRHPEKPGRHVLAIEADGASYHSGHTARERDRLRQNLLERRGWTFHRIWSTDWFNDADAQVQSVLESYRIALERDDADQAAQIDLPAPSALVELAAKSEWELPLGRRALPLPSLRRGMVITEYSNATMIAVVRHVRSDDVPRSADDELTLVMRELGFKSRGKRIVASIQAAQRAARG